MKGEKTANYSIVISPQIGISQKECPWISWKSIFSCIMLYYLDKVVFNIPNYSTLFRRLDKVVKNKVLQDFCFYFLLFDMNFLSV